MDIVEAACCVPADIHKSFAVGSAVGLLGIVLYQLVRKKDLNKPQVTLLQDKLDHGEGSSSEEEVNTNSIHVLCSKESITSESFYGLPYYEELVKESNTLRCMQNSAVTTEQSSDVTEGSNNQENSNQNQNVSGINNTSGSVRKMVEYFERRLEENIN
ncbi:uncharacterized protein [Halyomorpha halys]|uniref:uncharacterized protein n=1 Tax=Halyomorpha halys TaxID=286706 RepID=UPI0006D4D87E|nr:uncharacterized protein LOC106687795 [Halyomorpha halys]